jgi:hypothetical protein
MVRVEFPEEQLNEEDEENYADEHKGLEGFLIRKGLVRNEKQANILLLAVALVCLVVALVFFVF